MKAFFSALVMFFAATSAHAATVEELLAQGKAAYAKREFSAAGIQSAQEAAGFYEQAVAAATDASVKSQALIGQAESLYFVGNASSDNKIKIQKHLQGMTIADQSTKLLGLADVQKATDADVQRLKSTLTPEQMALMGESLYQRGTNLAQWGAANGVVESLSRWPELRDNMNLIVSLDLKSIHEFGPYRVLGRGYFKIPGILGGSTKKADQYLSNAVKASLAPGQAFSTNGYNNNYYADVLIELGRKADAKAMLEAFVKADAATLNPNLVIENQQAQKDAQEILKTL